MDTAILDRYDRRVPRYTSYPTANHFHAGVDTDVYAGWLADLSSGARLSLYAHIPFCDSLCWFCGCHTKIVRRHSPISTYLEALLAEVDTVAGRIADGPTVAHVHWGGGTPTILEPDEIRRLAGALRERFPFEPDAEFAVEIDPRGLARDTVAALADAGVNRASLGVQDLNAEVQEAINRVQPLDVTQRCVDWLRERGIDAINVDLMYGLPGQTVERVRHTVERSLALGAQRYALFGYAHVPWMKRHQKVLDRFALPGRDERWDQYHAAFDALVEAGYVPVGLDHFARPDDPMAVALRQGRLNRNFQGYTTDAADALVAFGASAIGAFPGGYVQNEVDIGTYVETVGAGRLAARKGMHVSSEDQVRRAVIERLMCDMKADVGEVSAGFGFPPDHLDGAIAAAEDLVHDGLVSIAGRTVEVAEPARPLLRTVCALFDEHLPAEAERRHAQAV